MLNPAAATIYAARIVLPIQAPPIVDGSLLVVDGRIRAVGRRDALVSANPAATLIDFGNAVLLPPMANAHTHLELTDFAVWAEAEGEATSAESFVDWILHLVRVRRSEGGQGIAVSLRNGVRQSLQDGTGVVGDICTAFEALEVYADAPLYGRVFAEVLGHDAGLITGRLARIDDKATQRPGPRLTWGVSPHAPYTLSAAALDRVFAFAARRALQCAIHLAESCEETQFMRQGNGAIADRLYRAAGWDPNADPPPGCSPVRALSRPGRLKAGDLVIHGVQVDDDDIAQLRDVGCPVVLCPRSNARLQVGKAPLPGYARAGINLCLGTDSLASAPSLSLWDELAFARTWFAGVLSPQQWLEMATLGGAKALGQLQVGRIAPGYDASFQVVQTGDHCSPSEIEEALCAAGDRIKVTHLYLAGRNVLPEL